MIPTVWHDALETGRFLIGKGVEPTSALKEAGAAHEIAYGQPMLDFITWARAQL